MIDLFGNEIQLSSYGKLGRIADIPKKEYSYREFKIDKPEFIRPNFDNSGTYIWDIEVYKNFFLVAFMRANDGRVFYFHSDQPDCWDKTQKVISSDWLLIGFNSNGYDIPILLTANDCNDLQKIKKVSDGIVYGSVNAFKLRYSTYDKPSFDSIDLQKLFKGNLSLKHYAARAHAKDIIELPYHPQKVLTDDEKSNVIKYCINDLRITRLLYDHAKEEIALREELGQMYGMDLRSASRARVAERVVTKLYGKKVIKPEYNGKITYKPPSVIEFKTEPLNNLLATLTQREYGAYGHLYMSPKDVVSLNSLDYVIRIGGLHTCEKNIRLFSNENYRIFDFDVTSFYPSIILEHSICPPQMGYAFISIFEKIYNDRLQAKKEKKKLQAEALKIIINSVYGKFGEETSAFWCAQNLIKVTLTGQLLIMMLAEAFYLSGIEVVSANTDGITVRCLDGQYDEMIRVTNDWQSKTNMMLEMTEYSILFSKDLNNYFAMKTDGEVKRKGIYASSDMSINPFALELNPFGEIVYQAIIDYYTKGIAIEEAIRNCKDFTKFLFVQQVKDRGAVKVYEDPRITAQSVQDDFLIGKVCRWYYAKDEYGAIYSRNNGNLISRTDEGAKLVQRLPNEFPNDINYNWYINEALSIIGVDVA